MLITVQFLNRVYHGEKSPGVVEWPPSPYRLFQALTAGVHTRQTLPLERAYAALRWLEAQGPPKIAAVTTSRNNQIMMAGKLNQEQSAMVRTISQVHLTEPMLVQYKWDITNCECYEDLKLVVSTLGALGHGIDKAFAILSMDNVDQTLQKWWVNNEMVGNRLRVPTIGTLDDLLHSHEFRMKFPQCPRAVSAFEFLTYVNSRPQNFVSFKLQTRDGRAVSLDPQITIRVAAWVRHAALEAAKAGFPGDAEQYVAGHVSGIETKDRFAYLPVPSIGYQHTDGYIRRVVVAASANDDGTMTAWAAQKLNGSVLTDKDGEFQAMMVRDDAYDSVLRLYTEPSRRWRSVTPIVLPHRWVRDRQKVEELFRLSIFPQAGLNVSSFQVIDNPWYHVLPRHGYCVPDYLRGHPLRHVEIELSQEAIGPIFLGAGRFRGLGMLVGTSK